MTLSRRIAERAVDFARAYDACGPDNHAARERVMQAAEAAIQRLLDEWSLAVFSNAGDTHVATD